ncbi:hypothetical protein EVAR_85857_1 [Eumeta japonica]|uniref:Uncharacterized protein n=1 Tax=Eumeta variegata TaxID=151549 RepID=A0A4C1UQD4_EUMVA|nr:hypothetical protein EVAR_85857_1 [Eumeta japonica]
MRKRGACRPNFGSILHCGLKRANLIVDRGRRAGRRTTSPKLHDIPDAKALRRHYEGTAQVMGAHILTGGGGRRQGRARRKNASPCLA